MSEPNAAVCRDLAGRAQAAADASALVNERDKHLASAKAWTARADRLEQVGATRRPAPALP